jgi:hypothetical protein
VIRASVQIGRVVPTDLLDRTAANNAVARSQTPRRAEPIVVRYRFRGRQSSDPEFQALTMNRRRHPVDKMAGR